MPDIPIQSRSVDESSYSFVDEEHLAAADKEQLLQDWQCFIAGGFRKHFFTENLYRFLSTSCGFIAHRNRSTFWLGYFNAEAIRLRMFLNQFGGNGHSVEQSDHTWLKDPAADLKQAMCQEMGRLYAPILQVLEDLEFKHAELGRAWRDFALRQAQDATLTSGIPDPGYPPYYLVSENTRNLLAYVAQIVLCQPPMVKRSNQEQNHVVSNQ